MQFYGIFGIPNNANSRCRRDKPERPDVHAFQGSHHILLATGSVPHQTERELSEHSVRKHISYVESLSADAGKRATGLASLLHPGQKRVLVLGCQADYYLLPTGVSSDEMV